MSKHERSWFQREIVDRIVIPRTAILWASAFAVLAAVIFTAIAVWITIAKPLGNPSDRWVLVGDEIAGGTLVLATLAAVVAVLAYGVSFRAPTILPEFKFFYCEPMSVTLVKGDDDHQAGTPLRTERPGPDGKSTQLFRQLELSIRVHNIARWSALNPALTIDMDGLILPSNKNLPVGWHVGKRDALHSIIAVTWEGRAVHGNQTLDLPDLDLAGLRASKEEPTLSIEVYADAFNDGYTFDVELLTLQEWETKYSDAVGGGFN